MSQSSDENKRTRVLETLLTKRVTLDFSIQGNLSLPGELSAGKELSQPNRLITSAPFEKKNDSARQDNSGHDAWTVDRQKRRTPTPMASEYVKQALLDMKKSVSFHPPAMQMQTSSNALDLIDKSSVVEESSDLTTQMMDCYALGDYTGTLQLSELVLGADPNHKVAKYYSRSSREHLEQLYLSRLGTLDQVPIVIIQDQSVQWLGLDHQASFILSRINSQNTIEEIIGVSGMNRIQVLKILVELFERNAIRLIDA